MNGYQLNGSVGKNLSLIILVLLGCSKNQKHSDIEQISQQQKIAAEIDSVLNDQYQLWYPQTVDKKYGGFLSRFSYDWQPVGPQNKFIVTQARHVWTSSKIAFH